MTINHVVVDGSNLATEGRTLPSLAQLDDAVRSFIEQYEPEKVTVVVDATFPNRIDPEERPAFEEATANAELVTPPAGVIGRGDAFLLEIADRADAVVLSNDSFQEFHGQFGWLFDGGRLIGGKPVPHVGWVFMDRAPVRGPLSRKSVNDARKAVRTAKAGTAATAPTSTPDAAAPAAAAGPAAAAIGGSPRRTRRSRRARSEPAAQTVGAPASGVAQGQGPAPSAPAPAPDPDPDAAKPVRGRRGRARGSAGEGSGPDPYNDPLPFIEFVGAHPVGSTVEATVERFSSHGAYVLVGETRCYVPLANLGDPPPRSAREVLATDGPVTMVVVAFDTPRRGVDLALPGFAVKDAETVDVPAAAVASAPDEQELGSSTRAEGSRAARARAAGAGAAEQKVATKAAATRAGAARVGAAKAVRKAAVTATTAKAAAATTEAAGTEAAGTESGRARAAVEKAGSANAVVKRAAGTRAAVKKAAVKKAAVKKAAVKKAAVKKAAVKKAAVKKAAVKKAAVKKAVAKKSAATKAVVKKATAAAQGAPRSRAGSGATAGDSAEAPEGTRGA